MVIVRRWPSGPIRSNLVWTLRPSITFGAHALAVPRLRSIFSAWRPVEARKSHGMTVPSRPKLMLRSSRYSSSRWPSLKLPLVRADLQHVASVHSRIAVFVPAGAWIGVDADVPVFAAAG